MKAILTISQSVAVRSVFRTLTREIPPPIEPEKSQPRLEQVLLSFSRWFSLKNSYVFPIEKMGQKKPWSVYFCWVVASMIELPMTKRSLA